MRILISTLTLLTLATLISACNTVAGAGQDISNGGQKLERSAEDNK